MRINTGDAGARGFNAPDGIVSVEIDPLSGQLAAPGCTNTRSEAFINGTQPQDMCRLHSGGGTRVASWDTAVPTSGEQAPQQQARPSRRMAQAQDNWVNRQRSLRGSKARRLTNARSNT